MKPVYEITITTVEQDTVDSIVSKLQPYRGEISIQVTEIPVFSNKKLLEKLETIKPNVETDIEYANRVAKINMRGIR
jgi:hypothetical protein